MNNNKIDIKKYKVIYKDNNFKIYFKDYISGKTFVFYIKFNVKYFNKKFILLSLKLEEIGFTTIEDLIDNYLFSQLDEPIIDFNIILSYGNSNNIGLYHGNEEEKIKEKEEEYKIINKEIYIEDNEYFIDECLKKNFLQYLYIKKYNNYITFYLDSETEIGIDSFCNKIYSDENYLKMIIYDSTKFDDLILNDNLYKENINKTNNLIDVYVDEFLYFIKKEMLSEVIDKYGDFDFKKLWVFCENCNLLNYKKTFLSKLYVCEECGYHIKINSSDRIQITIDKNTWNPLNQDLFSLDPLDFDDDTVNDSIYDDDTIDDNKTIKDETIYDNIINDYTIYDNNNTINDDDTIDEIYNIFKSQNFFDKNFVDCIDLRYLAELDEDLPFTLEELEEDLPFTKEELKGYLLLYQDELQEYLPFIKEKLKLDLPLLKEELEKYLSKEQEKLKLDLPLFKEELEKYLSKEQEKLKLDVSFLDQIYKLIEIKKKKRKEKKLKELYISFEEEIVRLIENQKKSIENELKIEKESNLNFYEILNDTIDKLLKEEEEKDNFKKAHYNNITDEIKKDIKLRSSFYKRISKEIQEKEIQEYEDKEKNKLKSAKPKKSNIHNIFNENFDEIEKNKSYIHRLNFYQEQTKLPEAVQTGIGKINDIKVALGVMDSEFLGGSMGSAVGEKLTCLIEYATKKNLPIIIFCASGGARIQEGVFSLIQMSKISAALHYYKSKKNSLYISVLTSPTAGGVIASFGMLGDIIISEPNTTIAFAGQRVIEQILKKEVPKGFQKAEYLFKQGAFDLILPRQLLKTIVTELLKLHGFYPCS